MSWLTIYANFRTKVPYCGLNKNNLSIIISEIEKLKLKKNSQIYDLGCGDGRFLFAIEKKNYKTKGYELSWPHYLKAKLKKILKKSKAKIIRKDFFEINLKEADLIFIFLVDTIALKLEKKIKKETKKNTIVISYESQLKNLKLIKTINTTKPSKTYIYTNAS